MILLTICFLFGFSLTGVKAVLCQTSAECVAEGPGQHFCNTEQRRCFSVTVGTSDFQFTSLSSLVDQENASGLTALQYIKVVDRASQVLRDLNPHRFLHLNVLNFDPVQELTVFRRELEAGQIPTKVQFDQRMKFIFQRMDDSHTRYITENVFRSALAFLPFSFAPYHDTRGTVLGYVVTDVATDFAIANPTFTVGAIIQSWNNVPIGQAVEQAGIDGHGSNRVARLERALGFIRFRLLFAESIPGEDSVILSYLSTAGSDEQIEIPWLYIIPSSPGTDSAVMIMDSVSSVDSFENSMEEARKHDWSSRIYEDRKHPRLNRSRNENEATLGELSRQASSSGATVELPVSNRLSAFLRAQLIPTTCGVVTKVTFGSFPLESDTREQVEAEIANLLESVPQDGLVIDIRANRGGSQVLVFAILKMLTAIEFECPRFSLRATALVNSMVNSRNAQFSDRAHRASMRTALAVGYQYTNSNEISDLNSIVSVPQVYFSKFVVIGNGRSFSAGDVFASIVKDNDLATLILEGGNTGAGGSTVRRYSALEERNPQLFPALPTGVDFSLAIARFLRPASSRGAIVENFGVDADLTYFPTLDDRLNNDHDLMETAVRTLRGAFCAQA